MELSRLKELLHYCPATGNFTWIKKANHKISVGKKAGHLSSRGYIAIRIDGRQYQAHRLAALYMTGNMPPEDIDHINHQKTDNRWDNLRLVSRAENNKNRPVMRNNKTGVVGISHYDGFWEAGIRVNRKRYHLYYGRDFFEACCARKSAEIEHGFHTNHGAMA